MRLPRLFAGLALASCTFGCTNASASLMPHLTTAADATPQSPTEAPATTGLKTYPLADGEPWVVFEGYETGAPTKSIFLARPDGSGAHTIAKDAPGEHLGPVWSPDGRRIAFVARDETTPSHDGIWLVDADGSNAARLFDPRLPCPDGAFWPAWSPDGTKLSITCYVAGDSTLQVVDIATLAMTQVVSVKWPEFFNNPASWSPDGASLAFDVLHWDPTNSFIDGSLIDVVPSVGGNARPLTDGSSFASWPDWSPTGNRISYNTYTLGDMDTIPSVAQLLTIKSDGTDRSQLTAMTEIALRLGQARWSSDGLTLVTTLAHGNPKDWVEIAFVSASTGSVTTPATSMLGARADLRPGSHP